MAKLIFGCGYLGQRVARLWRDAGATVFAATRSEERAASFAAAGLRPLVVDITSQESVEAMRTSTEMGASEIDTVLFAVGFDRSSSRSIHEVYADGLARVLDRLPASVQRFIYISSTGVYGQVTGESVDESSPCAPTRDGGRASLAAEETLRRHPLGQKSIILRLAGIYGPNRIPRAADLQAGLPIDAPADGTLNLIHVDDAARIVLLAEQQAQLPSLYVVSDGQPAVRGEYYRELARLLGAPEPRFVAPSAGSPAAQRAASDKRVDNRRLVADLRPQFDYPSYREGLAAIVAAFNRNA